jgi:hypothetical protein
LCDLMDGGDGLDEVSLGGPTFVAELIDSRTRRYEIDPADFGLEYVPPVHFRTSSAEESKATIINALSGKDAAARDIVALKYARPFQKGERRVRTSPARHRVTRAFVCVRQVAFQVWRAPQGRRVEIPQPVAQSARRYLRV